MKRITLLLCGIFLWTASYAQIPASIKLPRKSPAASVSQRVGFTDITVDYHSPAVKGREVWGTNIAPYNGKPYPWRAGANENTVITFSDDVLIEGNVLNAGTYGLHILPSERDFTIIFSTNSSSWGSFFYKESEDALRVKVKPKKAMHREWLNYDFEIREADHTVLVLHWEKLRIPFKIAIAPEITVNHIRNQLRSSTAFTKDGHMLAANYCLDNAVNQEEAIGWIDRSLRSERNFRNLSIKAGLLSQIEKSEEAQTIMEEAFSIATVSDLYAHVVLQRVRENQDQVDKATALLLDKHPDTWQAQISGGEQEKAKGNIEKARKHFEKALTLAPAYMKAGIENQLTNLEN